MARLPRSPIQRQSTLARSMLPGSVGGRSALVAPEPRPLPKADLAPPPSGGSLAPEWVKITSPAWTQGVSSGMGTMDDFAFDRGTNTDGSAMSGLPSWISTTDNSFFDLTAGIYWATLMAFYGHDGSSPDGVYLTIDQSAGTYIYAGAVYTMSSASVGTVELSCTLPFFVPVGSTLSWSAAFGHSHSSSMAIDVEASFLRLPL